jgi:epoxyqueuosine reductase
MSDDRDEIAERTRRVLARCRELGFTLAGVADPRPSDRAEAVRRWFAEGKHGSMAWLADEIEVRLDPGRLLSGVRSVICVADRYAGPSMPIADPGSPDRPRGAIARYARGGDYHEVIKRRLKRLVRELRDEFPQERFRHACDLLPLLERELAGRAGLGSIGKHTLLIEPGVGSWLLLGEVLTTLPLAIDPASSPGPRRDPCGTCTRCIDACPTRAITPFSVDASRCLAYTTIEHRGEVPDEFHAPTGGWLFGCDVCQEVCPHNAPTRRKRREAGVLPEYAERTASLDLVEILGWSEEDRRRATRASPLRRCLLASFKRNALICLGNALVGRNDAAAATMRERIVAIAGDVSEDAVVRSTAAAVLARLA